MESVAGIKWNGWSGSSGIRNLLSSWFMAGLEREKINTEALHARLECIGLIPSQIPAIIDMVPWNKFTAG